MYHIHNHTYLYFIVLMSFCSGWSDQYYGFFQAIDSIPLSSRGSLLPSDRVLEPVSFSSGSSHQYFIIKITSAYVACGAHLLIPTKLCQDLQNPTSWLNDFGV